MSIELTPGRLEARYEQMSASAGRDLHLLLDEIVMRPGALNDLVEVAGSARSVVIVADQVEMFREGVSIKPLVQRAFTDAGREVTVIVLPGQEVHTTMDHVRRVQAALRKGQVVVALGSGVVADITKYAVFGFESEHPDTPLRLIVVQTANSVCAFTSGLSVVTMDGVKRTVVSRLPDVLLLDTQVLADAPLEYSHGGIGDASVAAVSFADYRLSHLMGLTDWEPLSWELMEFSRSRFLSRDPVLADYGFAGMGATALDLAACGLSMTVAGESAPLSGLEHVTSHTLDMAAASQGRPVGNHGSQCALATVLSLIAWERLLELDDLSGLDPERIDPEQWRPVVEAAFSGVDADGSAWRECWSDFSTKIATWQSHAEQVRAFLLDWSEHRDDLRRYVCPPKDYVAALAATGHPLRWEDIPTGITQEHAKWAFSNARLMRKRTSVADLLGFAGLWTPELIDGVFDTYHQLIGPYLEDRSAQ